jgi:peptidoglycan-associated lipoprotein
MKLKHFASFAGFISLTACASLIVPNTKGYCVCAAPGTEEDLVANVGDRVFYPFDKATLGTDADATLGRQALWLSKYASVKILVAGNTDDRGTETYNLALGGRRADAVRDYLVAQGVSESRIQTISYGKECPVAIFNGKANDQENRNAITSVRGLNPQNCH